MKTKTALLWIVDWSYAIGENKRHQVTADLFFSSREKFAELYTCADVESQQLVTVRVPANFEDWDYMPNDY